MLQIGLYRILTGDLGFVNCGHLYEKQDRLSNNETHPQGSESPISYMGDQGCPSDESLLLLQRVRYCKHYNAHVKGFDHHCPAFGNCIGQNNRRLFMSLLTGFITLEACYILGASQILASSRGKVCQCSLNHHLITSCPIRGNLVNICWFISIRLIGMNH